MGTFLVVIGALLLFLGFPISIIVLIVKAIKRKPLKNILISIAVCFFGSFVIVGVGGSMLPDDEIQEQEAELDTEESIERETEQVLEEQVEDESKKEKVEKEKAEAEKKAKEKAKKEEKANTFEYADITMKYLRSEITCNSIDEKCLYVYFEMTNNSDENQAFSYLVTCKAFQNGIELDTNYIYDCDEEKNGSKEIQPNTTITVAEVFELGDSIDDVTLEVRPFNIWSDRLLFQKEIQITE